MEFKLIEIILTPLFALLIPIIWNFASIPISYLRELAMKKPAKVRISLDFSLDNSNCTEKEKIEEAINKAELKCLIIRYGTDQYISTMANDQEKFDGRLRNRVILVNKNKDEFEVEIPLHKRIGTQFKLFIDCDTEDSLETLMRNKDHFQEIKDISRASSDSKNKRLFLLLKTYGVTKTVDELENNMLFPI